MEESDGEGQRKAEGPPADAQEAEAGELLSAKGEETPAIAGAMETRIASLEARIAALEARLEQHLDGVDNMTEIYA